MSIVLSTSRSKTSLWIRQNTPFMPSCVSGPDLRTPVQSLSHNRSCLACRQFLGGLVVMLSSTARNSNNWSQSSAKRQSSATSLGYIERPNLFKIRIVRSTMSMKAMASGVGVVKTFEGSRSSLWKRRPRRVSWKDGILVGTDKSSSVS